MRRRLEWLIEHHHRHHQLGDGYKPEPAERLKSLVDGLNALDVANEELRGLARLCAPESAEYLPEFPLLILFGFADTLACRGPESQTPVSDVARIDLALLASWIAAPRLRAREREIRREQDDHDEMFPHSRRSIAR